MICPADVVDNILQQVNQHPNGTQIKKLLMHRLDMEIGSLRGVLGDVVKVTPPEIYDLEN